jgi:hypothetical protein
VHHLEHFCFPSGVETSIVRRTPSLSSLNEILYGPSYLSHSSTSFIFLLTGDGTFLYGICITKNELLEVRQLGS